MSNRLVVDKWGAVPNFAGCVSILDSMEKLPEIRTFFGKYKNPIGIEVEVEGVTKSLPMLSFWTVKEDGSLRDHGAEFVSVPLSGRQIDYALHELETLFKNIPHRWSHRCSIHVHQNFSTMREKHLMAYTMVYGLFEELFYSMVEPYRAANAFCYKATSLDPHDYAHLHESNKYCGLNLAPLQRQCTVEFRHMHGTDDFRLIRRWIQLIVKLHAWIEGQSSKDVVSNVLSYIEKQEFVELAERIWGVNAQLFEKKFIQESANANAIWALCLAKREFH